MLDRRLGQKWGKAIVHRIAIVQIINTTKSPLKIPGILASCIHNTSKAPVTDEEKKNRALEIAQNLSDNKEWKSHGRPISREELGKLKLQIDQLEAQPDVYVAVTTYHELMIDYVRKYDIRRFIQTRRFL